MISVIDDPGGNPGYPKEDKCRVCGVHLGWILNPEGEMVALGLCDKHKEKEEK